GKDVHEIVGDLFRQLAALRPRLGDGAPGLKHHVFAVRIPRPGRATSTLASAAMIACHDYFVASISNDTRSLRSYRDNTMGDFIGLCAIVIVALSPVLRRVVHRALLDTRTGSRRCKSLDFDLFGCATPR